MTPHIKIERATKLFSIDTTSRHAASPDLEQNQIRDSSFLAAVDNVSLEIIEGERVGIIGRNGAGKSTLLHLIAGIAKPTSGSIDVIGKVTAVMTLGIGLREEATGRENIYLDGEVQGVARSHIDAALDDIISFADLGKFIDYPVRTYSTGMKARLAFSMITHLEPEILIIDEALSAGDAAFAAKATRRIKELCKRGKIVIVVSHGMGTIIDICNRCLWMDTGRIEMDGKPVDVTQAYVEAVREADEKDLLEKFGRDIGCRSLLAGWTLCAPEILIQDQTRQILPVGSDAIFSFRGAKPPETSNSSLVVEIVRLDGVVLFKELFRITDAKEEYRLAVRMNPLVIGCGIYRLSAKAAEAGLLRAESSCIFEVVHPDPPTGGKPMLFPETSIEITKA